MSSCSALNSANLDTFEDGLKENLLRGIYGFGLEKTSPVQQRAVKPIIMGDDILIQAKHGCGKTTAYVIGVLQLLDSDNKNLQVIVLAPTAAETHAIARTFAALGDFMDIRVHTSVGVHAHHGYAEMRSKGAHVLVGTPGKVLDLLNRCAICMDSVAHLVLDHSDDMLGRGMQDQIKSIYVKLPSNVQVITVTETLPVVQVHGEGEGEGDGENRRVPVHIVVEKQRRSMEGTKQYYFDVDREEWKFQALLDLYATFSIARSIIFCNTTQKLEWLAEGLTEKEFQVTCLHAALEKAERERTIRKFRCGDIPLLICTDMFSDYTDVDFDHLLINYELPVDVERFVFRVNRYRELDILGFPDQSNPDSRKKIGASISLLTKEEMKAKHEIEEIYKFQMKELPADLTDLSY